MTISNSDANLQPKTLVCVSRPSRVKSAILLTVIAMMHTNVRLHPKNVYSNMFYFLCVPFCASSLSSVIVGTVLAATFVVIVELLLDMLAGFKTLQNSHIVLMIFKKVHSNLQNLGFS